jgi:hypothetical protein
MFRPSLLLFSLRLCVSPVEKILVSFASVIIEVWPSLQ